VYFRAVLILLFLFIQTAAQARDVEPWWKGALLPEKYPEETVLPGSLLENSPISLTEAMRGEVRVFIFRKPLDFDYEFAIVTENGKIRRAFLVSTSMPGKAPARGYHRLEVETIGGVPWPWHRSIKYQNSPMYWGLQIHGGYFIHSSPHYGNLGKPASMGCVRASFPDAMELFELVANVHAGRPSYIIIFEDVALEVPGEGARVLRQVLSESSWSIERLKSALAQSRAEVEAVSKGDLEFAPGVPADAHVRPGSGVLQKEDAFPVCGAKNCWGWYKKPRTTVYLKPDLVYPAPVIDEYSSAPLLSPLHEGDSIELSPLLGGLEDLDPLYVHEIGILLTPGQGGAGIRVCEKASRFCSRIRGGDGKSGASVELVYPLHEVADRLKSSLGLTLEMVSGSGTIESVRATWYQKISMVPEKEKGGGDGKKSFLSK